MVAITYPISFRHIRQTPSILLKNSQPESDDGDTELRIEVI